MGGIARRGQRHHRQGGVVVDEGRSVDAAVGLHGPEDECVSLGEGRGEVRLEASGGFTHECGQDQSGGSNMILSGPPAVGVLAGEEGGQTSVNGVLDLVTQRTVDGRRGLHGLRVVCGQRWTGKEAQSQQKASEGCGHGCLHGADGFGGAGGMGSSSRRWIAVWFVRAGLRNVVN